MPNEKHKVFISYHHENDEQYKEALLDANERFDLFVDWSVDTGGIDDSFDDQTIRTIIRDDYLQDSTVTIVLVGTETKYRKHVDWEIYSSMYDGAVKQEVWRCWSSTCRRLAARLIPLLMATPKSSLSTLECRPGHRSRPGQSTRHDILTFPIESSTTL